jgi:hypothetical protein
MAAHPDWLPYNHKELLIPKNQKRLFGKMKCVKKNHKTAFLDFSSRSLAISTYAAFNSIPI